MTAKLRIAIAALVCSLLWGAAAPRAQAQAPASGFVWPRLIVYIGFSAFGGVGGYDTYGRTLARYIGKYLPGNPTVSVENKPGAGSLTLMNYMATQAAKDGTEIAIVASGVVADPLLLGKKSNARFDPAMFNWVGNMNKETAVFAVMQNPPVSLRDILDGKSINVGATGTASDNYIYGVLFQTLFHTHLNIIPAYPGMNEVELAMDSGELAGITGVSWDSLRYDKASWLQSGRTKALMQFALERHRDLPDAPAFPELVKSPDERQLVNMILARQSMGRPIVTHPSVAPERVAQLQSAFEQAMRDPQLIADCATMNLIVNWTSGRDVKAVVESIARTPPEVVAHAQSIFAGP